MISILDVRKDARVTLRNGFTARVMDNKSKGATRLCEVDGFCTEMGSVYSTDILEVLSNGSWEVVEHTPSQMAGRALRQSAGW